MYTVTGFVIHPQSKLLKQSFDGFKHS